MLHRYSCVYTCVYMYMCVHIYIYVMYVYDTIFKNKNKGPSGCWGSLGYESKRGWREIGTRSGPSGIEGESRSGGCCQGQTRECSGGTHPGLAPELCVEAEGQRDFDS